MTGYLYAILFDPQADRLFFWETPEEVMHLEEELNFRPYEFPILDFKAFEEK